MKSILNNIKAWLTEHHREIFLFSLALLISTISFGLGYIIRGDLNRAPIIIEKISK